MALLGASILGSAGHLARLLSEGRGQYRATLRDILDATPSRPILVGADHDFRVGLVVDYHTERLGLHPALRFVRSGEMRSRPPEWHVEHRPADEPAPPAPRVSRVRGGTLSHAWLATLRPRCRVRPGTCIDSRRGIDYRCVADAARGSRPHQVAYTGWYHSKLGTGGGMFDVRCTIMRSCGFILEAQRR